MKVQMLVINKDAENESRNHLFILFIVLKIIPCEKISKIHRRVFFNQGLKN